MEANPRQGGWLSIPAGRRADRLAYFLARVSYHPNMEACWTWTGSVDRDSGYGNASLITGNANAHQLAWLLEYGPIPRGWDICHECDNRLCVNPAHLFIGTRRHNLRDMWAKGRGVAKRGEECCLAKLTAADVRLIRAELAKGVPKSQLAARFGTSHRNISSIYRRVSWRHLD